MTSGAAFVDDAISEKLDLHEVSIGGETYPYFYGENCTSLIADEIAGLDPDRFVVVSDDEVLRLHGDALLPKLREIAPLTVISREPGEAMKSLSWLSEVLERVLAEGVSRKSVVVGFGGGVPGNLAGVIAALLFRGIRLVHVPTTTIAAADSVLSLKQAINSRVGKNHVGTYLTPTAVFTDGKLLETLPVREQRSGLCEMAKNCLAICPDYIPVILGHLEEGPSATTDLFRWLLKSSIEAKTSVTVADAKERSLGLVLEYGHTAGHAIELLDHRNRGAEGLSHGECVALGMIVAAHVSLNRGWLSRHEFEVHEEVVRALGVDTTLPKGVAPDQLIEVIKDDNKRGYLDVTRDSTPFVLLRQLGVPARTGDLPLVDVSFEEIHTALLELW